MNLTSSPPLGPTADRARDGRQVVTPKGPRRTGLEAYCLKCREKREMKDPQPITMKNGKPATSGICPVCGTKMFKIGKTPAGVA